MYVVSMHVYLIRLDSIFVKKVHLLRYYDEVIPLDDTIVS